MEGENVGQPDPQEKMSEAQTVQKSTFGKMSLTLKYFNLQLSL